MAYGSRLCKNTASNKHEQAVKCRAHLTLQIVLNVQVQWRATCLRPLRATTIAPVLGQAAGKCTSASATGRPPVTSSGITWDAARLYELRVQSGSRLSGRCSHVCQSRPRRPCVLTLRITFELSCRLPLALCDPRLTPGLMIDMELSETQALPDDMLWIACDHKQSLTRTCDVFFLTSNSAKLDQPSS